MKMSDNQTAPFGAFFVPTHETTLSVGHCCVNQTDALYIWISILSRLIDRRLIQATKEDNQAMQENDTLATKFGEKENAFDLLPLAPGRALPALNLHFVFNAKLKELWRQEVVKEDTKTKTKQQAEGIQVLFEDGLRA